MRGGAPAEGAREGLEGAEGGGGSVCARRTGMDQGGEKRGKGGEREGRRTHFALFIARCIAEISKLLACASASIFVSAYVCKRSTAS